MTHSHEAVVAECDSILNSYRMNRDNSINQTAEYFSENTDLLLNLKHSVRKESRDSLPLKRPELIKPPPELLDSGSLAEALKAYRTD